jgi:hypothetical protein
MLANLAERLRLLTGAVALAARHGAAGESTLRRTR